MSCWLRTGTASMSGNAIGIAAARHRAVQRAAVKICRLPGHLHSGENESARDLLTELIRTRCPNIDSQSACCDGTALPDVSCNWEWWLEMIELRNPLPPE